MTPRVQGYSFVDAMPSPSPSELGPVGVNALMTFGTLASTPVAIRDPNKDDVVFKAPAPHRETPDEFQGGRFRISQTSRRDMLAHKMASKASRSLAKRHQATGNSSGLGLLRLGNRTIASSSPGASPGPSSVRSVATSADPSATPGRDSFLSPAAKTLLGRAKGAKGGSDLSPAIKRRNQEDRDRESAERLKRQKWDPSPLRSGVA
jgi:protein DGCR14